jgi:hypothetical protein
VSLDTDGDFVIAWSSVHDGGIAGVFARRFSSAGVVQAGEFQVNAYTPGSQGGPSASLDADGDFVIAWSSLYQDGDSGGGFARRFSSTGVAQASEFQVNAYTPGGQSNSSVSLDADGDFVIAWSAYAQDGDQYGIFARTFSSAGIPTTAEFRVNSFTSGGQDQPSVSVDDSGDFVVVWLSGDQDGDDGGVFAQRFKVPAVLDIDGNGDTDALTDGLLVLRFLFGFTGTPLIGGAVDAVDCTRCDAGAIQGYLQTLL